MSKRIVSEKTLELNISSELLGLIRKKSGCKKAFWIGMKQKQEARNGIDELIANVPKGRHLALQFKSPRQNPKNGPGYYLSINDNQNNNLLRLSKNHRDSVFYVFPAYNTFQKMDNFSPNLMNETYFMRVADTRSLPAASNKNGRHKVHFESDPPGSIPTTATIYSNPFNIKLLKADNLFQIESIFYNPDPHITHQELQSWLGNLFDTYYKQPRRIGQMMRGFSTICIQE